MLLGRGAECQHIDTLLESARSGRSHALVVTGEPGIGKSALLDYASSNADGFTQLHARCLESESQLAFHVLADLFRAQISQIEEIPEAHAAALRSAFGFGPAASAIPGDPFLVSAATLSLLGRIAEEGPLLVLVDDAHWADGASGTAFAFAARRLNAEGIVFMLATRSLEEGSRRYETLPELVLRGLDVDDTRNLFSSVGERRLDDASAAALQRVTGGNPLAVREVALIATEDGIEPARALDEPLQVGPLVQNAFEHRLARLGNSTRDALVVAAASDTGRLEKLLPAIRLLGIESSSLDAAEAAQLITLRQGALEFQHPLLRSVVYHAADPSTRRRAHRVLAESAMSAEEADRRAWHLAKATVEPDEEVAAAVASSAVRAQQRNGYASAAQLFRLAASLTPDKETRAGRLLEAAGAAYFAGLFDEVLNILDDALSTGAGQDIEVEIQQMRARVLIWSRTPMRAHDLLVSEAHKLQQDDPQRAGLILAEAAAPCFMAGRLALAVDVAVKAHELARTNSGPNAMLLDSILGEALTLTGQTDRAEELLGRALARVQANPSLLISPGANYLCLALVVVERDAEAEQLVGQFIATARGAGAVSALPYMLAVQSELLFRMGNWDSSYASATESVRLAIDTGQSSVLGYCGVCLARIEAALGLEGDCRRHVVDTQRAADQYGNHSLETYAWSALGLLELGLGNVTAAVRVMAPLPDYTVAQGLAEPNIVQWRPDYIEALVRGSRLDEAEDQVRVLENEACNTRRKWAQGAAARCRGLLATQRQLEFADHFEAAIAVQSSLPSPFELARTELCYAESLRRQRQHARARDLLHRSADKFQRLGATPWLRKAQAELVAAGDRDQPRPLPRVRELTPQELQVALRVANGLTNREVANQLFLSVKTVETHLARVYSKLEVRSRSQLTRLFATGADASPVGTS